MNFQIQSKNFLQKCDTNLRQRLIRKIELLQTEPIIHDSKHIIGELRSFRIRVGDYRVLYDIMWEEKIVLIAKIDKRSKIYK